MSKPIAQAVRKLQLKRAERTVLLELALYANDDGTHIFPSDQRLGASLGYTTRHLRRILEQMEKTGLIERTDARRGGRNRRAEYAINLEKIDKMSTFPPENPDILSAETRTFCPNLGTLLIEELEEQLPATPDVPHDLSRDLPPIDSKDAPGPACVGNDLPPFTLFEAYCRARNYNTGDFSKRDRSKHLGIAKRLSADGYTADDIAGCTHYLLNRSYGETTWDLAYVSSKVGAWIREGRPERPPSTRPKVVHISEQFREEARLADREPVQGA